MFFEFWAKLMFCLLKLKSTWQIFSGLPMGITLDENIAYGFLFQIFFNFTLFTCFSVIGGFDGAERVRLRSGERYDRREGHWTNISPMNEARSVAGCALIDGRIYLVGGCNGEATNTVEM